MLKASRPIVLVSLAAFLALGGFAGCAAPLMTTAGLTALQTGSTAFIRGELETADAIPMNAFYESAHDALTELGFRVLSSRINERDARIRALETGGRSIRIDLEKKSPSVTKMNIRVGVFGDQAMSRLLQQAISDKLPPTGTAPPMPDVHRPGPAYSPGGGGGPFEYGQERTPPPVTTKPEP